MVTPINKVLSVDKILPEYTDERLRSYAAMGNGQREYARFPLSIPAEYRQLAMVRVIAMTTRTSRNENGMPVSWSTGVTHADARRVVLAEFAAQGIRPVDPGI